MEINNSIFLLSLFFCHKEIKIYFTYTFHLFLFLSCVYLSGTAVQTLFSIECSGWRDEGMARKRPGDDSQVLRYTFYAEENGRSKVIYSGSKFLIFLDSKFGNLVYLRATKPSTSMTICSLRFKGTFCFEVIHVFLAMRSLCCNWAFGSVSCPGYPAFSAGIKCQHFNTQVL